MTTPNPASEEKITQRHIECAEELWGPEDTGLWVTLDDVAKIIAKHFPDPKAEPVAWLFFYNGKRLKIDWDCSGGEVVADDVIERIIQRFENSPVGIPDDYVLRHILREELNPQPPTGE